MIVGPVEEATVAEACCADCEGRPYEWCIVIEWILTILMYAIPPRSFLRREGCLAAGNLCTDQQCMYHTSECCPEPVYDPRF